MANKKLRVNIYGVNKSRMRGYPMTYPGICEAQMFISASMVYMGSKDKRTLVRSIIIEAKQDV